MEQRKSKELVWVRSSYKTLCSFSREARQKVGYQLRRVQDGEMPEDWKPMPTVGPGAIEIRVHQPHEHRVIYVENSPKQFMSYMHSRRKRKKHRSMT